MAKAAKPKAKPKKATPKLTDSAQSERFITTARELGIEKTDDKFSQALEKVLRLRPAR
jgi:hypothetical protein